MRPVRFRITNGDDDKFLQAANGQQIYEQNYDALVSFYPAAKNMGILKWNIPIYSYFNMHDASGDHLLDSDGAVLNVPWPDPAGPTYPRQTADISEPAYRQAWIAKAKEILDAGYDGIFIDDPNVDVEKSAVRTGGKPPIMDMSWWPAQVADFMAEIRTALLTSHPNAKIIHNVVWYSNRPTRWADVANNPVRKMINACDYVYIEGGFTDTGLTGGPGTASGTDFSLRSLLSFLDAIHEAKRNFFVAEWHGNDVERAYTLAVWLQVAEEGDGVGLQAEPPHTAEAWPLWRHEWGEPVSRMDSDSSALTAHFEHGQALVIPAVQPAARLVVSYSNSWPR